MTRTRQKHIERWVLEHFLESLNHTLGATYSFISSESPDFLLGSKRPAKLGIEIVELNHAHLSLSGLCCRQEEGIHEHLCRTIEHRWHTKPTPVAEVSLHLIERELPQKIQELDVADAILTMIRIKMPKEKCVSTISWNDLWQHPILTNFIHSFTIVRIAELDRPYVHSSHASFLPPLSHELLQAAFSRKNSKVAEYRKRCHSIWLVAVHNLPNLSTQFSSHDSAICNTYDLAFDRTFIFDAIRKKAIEIKRQQPRHSI